MREYKSQIFRYDDLNWSEEEIKKVFAEAEALRAEHNGTMEKLEGHISRSRAFSPALPYYAIPEHWPGLLVIWEEEESEEQHPDCDIQCFGCDRACADRIPASEPEEEFDPEEGEGYELTIEYTYRMAVKFRAKSDKEAASIAEAIATSDDMMNRIDTEGEREIDYALCDVAGCTIIDWN